MPIEPDINRTLTDENVRKAAVSCLSELFPEEIAGHVADKAMVLDVLVMEAARNWGSPGTVDTELRELGLLKLDRADVVEGRVAADSIAENFDVVED